MLSRLEKAKTPLNIKNVVGFDFYRFKGDIASTYLKLTNENKQLINWLCIIINNRILHDTLPPICLTNTNLL